MTTFSPIILPIAGFDRGVIEQELRELQHGAWPETDMGPYIDALKADRSDTRSTLLALRRTVKMLSAQEIAPDAPLPIFPMAISPDVFVALVQYHQLSITRERQRNPNAYMASTYREAWWRRLLGRILP